MRNAFGGMGVLCGAIVVALVARYGFKTTDVEFDAWIMAFMFGVIATFGLGGHAFAVYLWRHNKAISIIAGLVAALSLGINLSNSLGAIAGRSDVASTERIEKNRKIRSAEAELKRLTDLRDTMPAFVTTDGGAVRAAQTAADAARQSRAAECGNGDPKKRGKNCRDREADERAANDRLAQVTAAKAATDRASKLESDADKQRKILGELGPVVVVNVQGSTIAKLFRLPDDEAGYASTMQQFGTAAIVELIILVCLIGWEASRPKGPQATAADMAEAAGAASEIEAAPPPAPAPEKLPAPPRPRLATAKREPPAGPVPRIMTAALEPSKGSRVELGQAFTRYSADCRSEGRQPVDPEVFMDAMARFCKSTGIKTRIEGNSLFLLDVQLVNLASEAVS